MQPPSPGARHRAPETDMLDLALLAATAGFFVLSLAYVRGCDRL
jgi:hypothetical protein